MKEYTYYLYNWGHVAFAMDAKKAAKRAKKNRVLNPIAIIKAKPKK